MNRFFHSISSRFIVGAVGTAALTFLGLIGLVLYQLDNSLARQESKLETISEARLAEVLDADVRLVAQQLDFLVNDTARRVAAIASRADTIAAVVSRNVVAISELLGPAATNADVDGIVVVDRLGNVIGASTDQVDLIGISTRMHAAGLAERIAPLLNENSPSKPATLIEIATTETVAPLIPGQHDGHVSEVIFVPLFDDFGDVSGGLVAQRWLRQPEPLLVEFAKMANVRLAVFLGDDIISSTGTASRIEIAVNDTSGLGTTTDGNWIARCGPALELLSVCTLKPIEDLYAIQNELTKIAKEEERSLVRGLFVFGLFATLLFIITSVLISRQITQPLTRITKVVGAVAEGSYGDHVDGTDRFDEVGDIARAVVVLQDSIRERDSLRANIQIANEALQRQEAELRTQNVLFDAALNNMSHGLCMFDADKRLIVSNQRHMELFGLEPEQVRPGMTLTELMSSQNLSIAPSDDLGDDDVTADDDDWPSNRRSSVTHRLSNGRIVLTTRQPLADGGWVAIYEDITERQQARDRLLHLAKHDVLTDLPNRIQMREHLSALLRRRDAEGGTFGLLYVDLDEFKTVNDSLGHPVGDQLLREVASRLVRTTSDRELVARLGGDEFAIVTDIPAVPTQLADLAQRVIAEVSRPYNLEPHEAAIGASIGITIAHRSGVNADELLKQADLALYQAKADGRNTYRFFEQEMETLVNARHAMITDLRSALRNGELETYFQPQVSIETGAITGFEALMRWRHPERGMISPAEFIPIAEETGLIVRMGEWILRESCKAAATWPVPARIAVNISARQLRSRSFPSIVVNVLGTTGLAPERLELEITESVLLNDDEETRATLMQLKALGVKISMDDFGTGYSSLSCLRSFPFDKIKIDQSFVRPMLHSDESASIVHAIVELAQSLKMSTTAEGVESEELLERIRASGCREAQGYLFGRPAPAEVAYKLLLAEAPAARVASAG